MSNAQLIRGLARAAAASAILLGLAGLGGPVVWQAIPAAHAQGQTGTAGQPAPVPAVPPASAPSVGAPPAASPQPSAAGPATQAPPQPSPSPGPAGASQPAPTASTAPAVPQAPATPIVLPVEELRTVVRLGTEIDAIGASLDRHSESEDDLVRRRAEIEELMREAQRTGEALIPSLEAIRSQIEQLGPPPAAGQPPEAAGLVEERQRLNAAAGEVDAAIKRTELIQVRGRQYVGRAQELRHRLFTRDLMRRNQSPLRLQTWQAASAELGNAVSELGAIVFSWGARLAPRLPELAAVLLLGLAVYVASWRVLSRLVRHWQHTYAAREPTFFAKAAVAGLVAPARAVPPIAAAATLYSALESLDLLGLQMGWIAESVLLSIVVYVVVSALAWSVLEPQQSRWRLFDLSDTSARRLTWLICGIAALYAVDRALGDIIRGLYLSLSFGVATTALATLAFASLLIAIVRTPFEPRAPLAAAPRSRYWPHWIKLPLLAIAGLMIAVSLSGYVALGRFIAGQVLLTGTWAIGMFVLHLAIQALAARPLDQRRTVGRLLEQQLGLDASRRSMLSTLLSVVLNTLLAVGGIAVLLLTWGFTAPEILGWLKSLVFGFEVGQFRISLARILLALALFLALVFATRLVQRWLDARVFPSAKLEPGLSHSIHTGVGYGGTALAALAAVSYAGLDISNIAIVAGALSVGIGFGLQSIVNNFVSGLILLVERPMKVGDWVVVGDKEGIVRRISVRATEVETFDRSSLIVPNSQFVMGPIINWTHRNSIGRMIIRVSAPAHADPAVVKRLLEEVAARNQRVLSHPKPVAVLDNIAGGQLDYSLRFFLADVNDGLTVQTEIRMGVLQSLRVAGYDIVVPGAPAAALAPPGEAAVHVSISYRSDAARARDVLRRLAAEDPRIAAEPPPRVTIDSLGPSGIDMTLRFHPLPDAPLIDVQSDLRFALLGALRDSGIEIPHPQTDVHLRDLDIVRQALAVAQASRRTGAAPDAEHPEAPPMATPRTRAAE